MSKLEHMRSALTCVEPVNRGIDRIASDKLYVRSIWQGRMRAETRHHYTKIAVDARQNIDGLG
jgi:hypothetical protein